jgi:hypothetical protein
VRPDPRYGGLFRVGLFFELYKKFCALHSRRAFLGSYIFLDYSANRRIDT